MWFDGVHIALQTFIALIKMVGIGIPLGLTSGAHRLGLSMHNR